jgi:F-type H+-transporting ATPase subunit delta
MKSTKAATRYAKALLDLAVENNKTEQVSANMLAIISANEGAAEFNGFLNSPIISSEKKNEIFKVLFPNFESQTISFMELIAKNGRESILPAIAASYEEQLKEHKGIVSVILTSAVPLDAATKATILEKIKVAVKGQIELKEEIDASLIGGFVIKIGDNRIDASVVNQLKNLKTTFNTMAS